MYCLTVLYPVPADPDRFKTYYREKHIPLARRPLGAVAISYGYPTAADAKGDAPFCVFQALFEEHGAMEAALRSDIGQQVAADVPNYSPKGATVMHFPVRR